MTVAPVRLSLRGIEKSFPGVRALGNVDFELRAGEVHALCGENGAGKSTLMKIVAGEIRPDAGEMILDGAPLHLSSPSAAHKSGIVLVHQELALVPELTVAENIFLGHLPLTRWGNIDGRRLRAGAEAVLKRCGYEIDPSAPVRKLSIAARQTVEIARAWAFDTKIVIFDEPTASLSEDEAQLLFENIARLKHSGAGVIYITHRMNEITEIADRVSVLRDGEIRAVRDSANTSEEELTRLMFGRDLPPHEPRESGAGDELLRVEDIRVPKFVTDASFAVRQGEVVGLYGLIGSGRSELIEGILGLRSRAGGRVYWQNSEVVLGGPSEAFRLGIGYVPEDRRHQGLALRLSARANLALASLKRLSSGGVIDRKAENKLFDLMRSRLSIRVAGPRTETEKLSGGNQQKIVLGKWLSREPQLMILDEPTRGIDVNAKAEIYALIGNLVDAGMGIILISSETAEIMRLADRVLAFRRGQITAELTGSSLTEDTLAVSVAH